MSEWPKKIWNDPVWSKVIGTLIATTFLSAAAAIRFHWLSRIRKYWIRKLALAYERSLAERAERLELKRSPMLQIKSAFWGVSGMRYERVDLGKFVQSDFINVPVSVSTFGDPYSGQLKRLKVNYSYGALEEQKIIRREYSQLMLPPDWEMYLAGTVEILIEDCTEAIKLYETVVKRASDRVLSIGNSTLVEGKEAFDRIQRHATRAWIKANVDERYYPLPTWNPSMSVHNFLDVLRSFRSEMVEMFSEETQQGNLQVGPNFT